MALCKSRNVSPAMLAAARRNARKSTGPKTEKGKAFSALNAMKHGRTSRDFRGILARAGQNLDLFDWIFGQICAVLEPDTTDALLEVEMMAREVWISFWRSQRLKKSATKQEPAPKSADESHSRPSANGPLRIDIENPKTGAKVVFSAKRPSGHFRRTVRPGIMWFRPIAASFLGGYRPPSRSTAIPAVTVATPSEAAGRPSVQVPPTLRPASRQTVRSLSPDDLLPGAPLVERGSSVV